MMKRAKVPAPAFTDDHDAMGFVAHTPWHWQIMLDGEMLDFYPTRQWWRWSGKAFYGGLTDLLKFLDEKKLPTAPPAPKYMAWRVPSKKVFFNPSL